MKRRILIFAVLLCALETAGAQANKASNAPPKSPLPVLEIALSPDDDYEPLLVSKDWKQARNVGNSCDGDGNLYLLRPGMGVVGLTPKGLVSFLTDKMTDIPHAGTTFVHLDPSISPSGISFRVTGVDDAKVETTTWTDEKGHNHVDRNVDNATVNYIARFDKDGTYKGALKLDLPFVVYQFAAFDSGNLIAQGMDQNRVPRIALLDASAQFLRYLDLRKDISTWRSASGEDIKCNGCAADIGSVALNGYFTPWRGKILFKRELTGGARVYEIQDGGEVRVVDIKAPEGYNVGELVPTDKDWLFNVSRPDSKGVRSDSLLEVDPENGEPLREYRLKPPDKFPEAVVSCFFDNEFWGIRVETKVETKEEKLRVVRGSASRYKGK